MQWSRGWVGAFLSLSGAAYGQDQAEVEAETALVEQLADWEKPDSVVHLQLVLDDLVARQASALDHLQDVLASAAMWEELEELEDLIELRLLRDGLQIESFLPDPTGTFEMSGPAPLGTDGAGEEWRCQGGLCAGLPSGGDLAMTDWNKQQRYGGGVDYWRTENLSDGGKRTTMITTREDGSVDRIVAVETHPDGSGSVTTIEHDENSAPERVTEDEWNPTGEHDVGVGASGETTREEVGEGATELPPAEGGEGSYCPEHLAPCRALAEEVQDQLADPLRMIVGGAHVRPLGTEEPSAPLLETDPDDLVMDPEASPSSSSGTPVVRIGFPVQVLPPRPGN